MANRVAVNGCFDLFHPGHVHLITTAATLARKHKASLWLLINTDASVRSLKGEGRPFLNFFIRRAAAMAVVYNHPDKQVVGIHSEDHLAQTLEWLRPRFLVKGDDWKGKRITGSKHVDEIIWVPRTEWSATARAAASMPAPTND